MQKIPILDSEKQLVMRKKSSSSVIIAFLAAFLVVLAGALAWQMGWLPKGSEMIGGLSKGKKEKVTISDYSAVFLTNNQVYFGKLSDKDSQYPVLRDVYYLRAQRNLQPPDVEEEDKDKKSTIQQARPLLQQEMKLIKLGNELHGPKDEILLNRDHILFIEELKSDSRVVEAIEKFKLQ
jgi:hypothetical protein